MRARALRQAAAIPFILAAALILELPAQEAPAQKPLQYEVTVSLKLIQVYVTDKDGKPVTDLKKDDFTVLDNGQPVAVTEFEKHELQPAPEENRRPAEAETLIETPVETRALNRRFILFFDFAFNSQKGVVAGVQAALHFLDTQVLPGDEIALFSYSMIKGLKVHEYFATDHDKVREAVAKITGKEISGRAEEVEQAYWQLASIADDGAPPDQNFRVALNKIEGQRRDSQLQVRNYFLNLTAAAKALRLVPGQKNILFFSTGIPYSLI
jgi:VWFA-related protein